MNIVLRLADNKTHFQVSSMERDVYRKHFTETDRQLVILKHRLYVNTLQMHYYFIVQSISDNALKPFHLSETAIKIETMSCTY